MNEGLDKFIKRLPIPNGFVAPERLTYENIVAVPLKRVHLQDDLKAVNSSIETIQQTRGGSWPAEELTEEFDFLDLAWHEREFRDANSFAYVVYDMDGEYVGCVYIYPMGVRTKLSEELLQYDADVSWWVTKEKYENGDYEKLYEAIRFWVKEFPFSTIYFSNKLIPEK